MNYPTVAELDAMGATLTRDVDLCNDALRRWFGRPYTSAIPAAKAAAEPKRTVAWPRKRAGKRIA